MSHHSSIRLTGWILTLSLILMLEPVFFLMANGDSPHESLSGGTSSVSENASSTSENSAPESVSGDSLTETPKVTETPGDPGGEPYTPVAPVTSSPAEATETPRVTGTVAPTESNKETETTNHSSANEKNTQGKDTTSPTDEWKSTQNPSRENKDAEKPAPKAESTAAPTEKPGKESSTASSGTKAEKEEKGDKDENEHKKEKIRDTKAPTLMIYGIEDHSSVRKPVTVTVHVLEEHPSTRGLFARLAGANHGQMPLTQRMRREKGEIVYTLGPIREDDIYSLSLMAEDTSGHRTSKKLTFAVNTKGATFSVLSPESRKMSEAFAPRISIEDLEEVRITSAAINNEERAFSMKGNVLTFSEKITEEGEYTITVETVDAAGNENAMKPFTVTLSYKKKTILDAITSFLGRKHVTHAAANDAASSDTAAAAEETSHEAQKKENAMEGGEKTAENVPEEEKNTSSKSVAKARKTKIRQEKDRKKSRKRSVVPVIILPVALISAVFTAFWLRIRRKRRMAS